MKNSFLIVGLIFLGLILGCGEQQKNQSAPASNNQSAPAEKPIAVQSKSLTKEYDDNELAADGKYKGKMLAVSGKVSDIAETLGNVTVSLEGHDIVKSVMCNFEESEKPNVAKLRKGQNVTLVGKGDGMTAGLYVGLEKCKIQ